MPIVGVGDVPPLMRRATMGTPARSVKMDSVLPQLGVARDELVVVLIASVVVYLAVIVATRVAGLRSFSKMSAFDFAMTVAIGSIIASTAVGAAPLVAGVVAIAVLYIAQVTVSRLRLATGIEQAVDNTPLLLMYGPEIIEEHLQRARLTHDDLRAKLRAANVLRFRDVQAVVLETTGDVSVLQGAEPLDPGMLAGVRCGPVEPALKGS